MSNTNNNNYSSSSSSSLAAASSPRVKRHLTHADLTEDERRENPFSRDSVRRSKSESDNNAKEEDGEQLEGEVTSRAKEATYFRDEGMLQLNHPFAPSSSSSSSSASSAPSVPLSHPANNSTNHAIRRALAAEIECLSESEFILRCCHCRGPGLPAVALSYRGVGICRDYVFQVHEFV